MFFPEWIYDHMFNEDEMWYTHADGHAVLIMDLPIWDS